MPSTSTIPASRVHKQKSKKISRASPVNVLKKEPSKAPEPLNQYKYPYAPISEVATEYSPDTVPVNAEQIKRWMKTDGHRTHTLEILLSPEAVNFLFEINTSNRKLSETRARKHARDMANGRWLRNGQVLIISDTEIMNDGQQRLRAMQLYGKPVWCNVAFGFPRAAWTVTDTGKARSSADVIGILGVKNRALVAATLRLLIAYKEGLPEALNRPVSNDAIVRAYEEFSDIETLTTMFCGFSYPNRGFRTSVMNALAWMCYHSHGEEKTRKFLQILADGLGVDKNDAARQLRERFINEADVRSKLTQIDRFAIAIKALNYWVAGKPVTSLSWRAKNNPNESFPKVMNAPI